ncbi:MAG TPA: glycosyltransferase family 2 protein [Candidatus Pacearchaeota archaeon]|nr:glycosyltransferase family 2 protein [Candidatus Pacearchaeota archaeon]
MKYINSLKVGKASDLKNRTDRVIYRAFEMLPGILSFGGLILAVVLSFFIPFYVALFIIVYDIYWVFRAIYFGFYLRSAYKRMVENQKKDWLLEIENIIPQNGLNIKSYKDIYHLIILPTYGEPIEVVRNTLLCLKSQNYPKENMIIALGFERREKERAVKVAKEIKKEFENDFFKFLITCHPEDIEGEIAGHGSNGTWITRNAVEKIINPLNIPYENVIVSSFDIDCCVASNYFSLLTYYYLTTEKPLRTSYQPIPLYLNNIWQTPPVSRIFSWSATFWQTMNQERPEKLITFSSHSTPLKALIDVGFKQTNVVSDDSRIFWQCFFEYDGDYRTMPMFYPVSMDANCAEDFKRTLKNVYKQQKRWAYGVGEIPFYLFASLKTKTVPLVKKISMGFDLIEGHFTWATSSILIFLLGWLPLFLGGKDFTNTLMAHNLPRITSTIMTIAMFGLIGSIYISMLLIPAPKEKQPKIRYVWMVLEWALIPFVMIFFSALPALNAQAHWLFGKYMGFWVTPKVRK